MVRVELRRILTVICPHGQQFCLLDTTRRGLPARFIEFQRNFPLSRVRWTSPPLPSARAGKARFIRTPAARPKPARSRMKKKGQEGKREKGKPLPA